VTAAADARAVGARVEIRDLTKRYGGANGVLALDGLELDVPAGSVFGLLGPNGAGKTTTLRLLVGLARPTRGSVVIDEGLIDPARPDRRRGIGVLDQEPRYYGWMRGRELVEMVGRLHGLSATVARQRAAEVLERVHRLLRPDGYLSHPVSSRSFRFIRAASRTERSWS